MAYRKIETFVKQVNEKNTNGNYEEVLGVSIDKEFMPSVANTIGTDLKKYNVLRKNRFAFNPMHVGRDKKLPIAVYHHNEPALVSPAYNMFEVIDKNIDIDYLMLLFKTHLFDHLCWFYTDASVRGGLTWKDFCNIELDIKDINVQHKIVTEYNFVEKQIKNSIDEIDVLEKLLINIFNNLEKNTSVSLKSLTFQQKGIKTGKAARITQKNIDNQFCIPVIGAAGIIGYTTKPYISKRVISTGRVGTIGKVMIWDNDNWFTDNSLIIETDYIATTYCALKQYDFKEILGGSSNPKITQTDLENIIINVPNENKIKEFEKNTKIIIDYILLKKKEINNLEKLKDIIISKI